MNMEERGKELTEKERDQQAELQSLLVRLRQYQAQAEQTSQEALFVQQAINDHDKAIETITQLKKMKAGDEMLVAIGANSSVYVTLSTTDKIIVRLGGGVSAERPPDAAITYLAEMRKQLENSQRELTGVLQKLEQEAQRVQARLQELTAQSRGQQ